GFRFGTSIELGDLVSIKNRLVYLSAIEALADELNRFAQGDYNYNLNGLGEYWSGYDRIGF
ncbi:MAG: hypothetical protein ACREAC_32350, partial [Blastocatellia bacterium]